MIPGAMTQIEDIYLFRILILAHAKRQLQGTGWNVIHQVKISGRHCK